MIIVYYFRYFLIQTISENLIIISFKAIMSIERFNPVKSSLLQNQNELSLRTVGENE